MTSGTSKAKFKVRLSQDIEFFGSKIYTRIDFHHACLFTFNGYCDIGREAKARRDSR